MPYLKEGCGNSNHFLWKTPGGNDAIWRIFFVNSFLCGYMNICSVCHWIRLLKTSCGSLEGFRVWFRNIYVFLRCGQKGHISIYIRLTTCQSQKHHVFFRLRNCQLGAEVLVLHWLITLAMIGAPLPSLSSYWVSYWCNPVQAEPASYARGILHILYMARFIGGLPWVTHFWKG